MWCLWSFKCQILFGLCIRTNNRIRSLRFITFRFWNKIDEGSRQIRSVTLEKGLALRALVPIIFPAIKDDSSAFLVVLMLSAG
jgi:hypothetical protein